MKMSEHNLQREIGLLSDESNDLAIDAANTVQAIQAFLNNHSVSVCSVVRFQTVYGDMALRYSEGRLITVGYLTKTVRFADARPEIQLIAVRQIKKLLRVIYRD